VFVLRLIADNKGPATARVVEATIHDVEQEHEGAWITPKDFLPGNLRWTHTGERQLQLLITGAPKHFDLGEVRSNGQQCILVVALTPQPVRGYNILFPGKYRFRIALAAENAPVATSRFTLTFAPTWNATDEEAIIAGVRLEELGD
jgi:hypothetical protein